MLESGGIDAIINGTPDHWHSLINIAAAKAKKDIYSEKPLTLTIDEGKHVVKAVRDNKVILQTGTQQRSSQRFRMACELVRNGRIGKLTEVNVWLPAGLRGGPFASKPVPAHLNWDFWQGQAPFHDYVPERCHRTFRNWFDYSGGTMTDWGAHHMDIGYWAVGLPAPVRVESKPLATPIPGGFTTFSEYEVKFTYPNGVIFNVRTTTDDNPSGGVIKPDGQRNGIRFVGTDGWIWVNRDKIEATDRELLSKPLPEDAQRLYNEQRSQGKLLRVHAHAQGPDLHRRSGTPLRVGLPPWHHLAAHRKNPAMGSGKRGVHRRSRRRGEQPPRPRNAQALRLLVSG